MNFLLGLIAISIFFSIFKHSDKFDVSVVDKGCHYLRVSDELQRTVQYSQIHKTAVLYVLNKLESNSDIIRVTDRCYMPLC